MPSEQVQAERLHTVRTSFRLRRRETNQVAAITAGVSLVGGVASKKLLEGSIKRFKEGHKLQGLALAGASFAAGRVALGFLDATVISRANALEMDVLLDRLPSQPEPTI